MFPPKYDLTAICVYTSIVRMYVPARICTTPNRKTTVVREAGARNNDMREASALNKRKSI